MMWLLPMLLMPASAVIAGAVIWATMRNEPNDDGKLLRNFVLVLTAAALLLWQVGRTESMRLKLDPQFKIQTLLDADPVYTTIKDLAPDDGSRLRAFLDARLARGAKVSEALAQSTPLLIELTNKRLGPAAQETRVAWGRVVADTLIVLRDAGGESCFRLLAGQPLADSELNRIFSVENSAELRQAVVAVYRSAHEGLSRQRAADDERIESGERAREYNAIRESINLEFGREIEHQISNRTYSLGAEATAKRLCEAKIFELEEILELRPPLAARLIAGAVR